MNNARLEQRGQARSFRNYVLAPRTVRRKFRCSGLNQSDRRRATGSGSVRFGWTLVKLLATRLLPVRRSAAGPAATTALLRVAALALPLIWIASTGLSRLSGLRSTFAISRGEHDLEFDQFIPLCIRALPLGDSQQGLHSLARRYWLLFAHGCIVSSIGNFGIRMLTRPGATEREKSPRLLRTHPIRLDQCRNEERDGTQRAPATRPPLRDDARIDPDECPNRAAPRQKKRHPLRARNTKGRVQAPSQDFRPLGA